MYQKIIRLLKDSVIYGLGRYLNTLINIVLVPIYTRALSPDQYGIVEILNTVMLSLTLLTTFGLDTAMALVYFEVEEERRIEAASTALQLRLFLAILGAGIGMAAVPSLSTLLLHSSRYDYLLQLTLLAFPFMVLQLFCLDYLRLRFQPIAYSCITLTGVVLTVATGLILVLGLHAGAAGLVIANLLTAVVTGIAGLVACWRSLSPRLAPGLARKLLSYGMPLIPAAGATWIMGFSDRYLMTLFLDLSQLGIYAVALKLAGLLNFATAPFQLAWGPFALSIRNEPDANQTYARVLTYFLLFTMTIAVVLGTFAPEILSVFVGKSYAGASRVTGLLVLVPLLLGVYYVVSIGVSLAARTSYVSWTTGLAGIVSLGLNVLLIPRLGILGVAIASLSSQAVSTYAIYRVSQRYYPIPFDWPKALLILALGGGTLAIGTNLAPGGWTLLFKLASVAGYCALLPLLGIWGDEERRGLARIWNRLAAPILSKGV